MTMYVQLSIQFILIEMTLYDYIMALFSSIVNQPFNAVPPRDYYRGKYEKMYLLRQIL